VHRIAATAGCRAQPPQARETVPSKRLAAVLCMALALLLSTPFAAADPGRWILVDTAAGILSVMEGDRERAKFQDIARGRGGVGTERYRGDHRTPLGEFRVSWVNPNSIYHLFFGLDFPTLDFAERAYESGRIDMYTYFTIRRAVVTNRVPPQDTPLGGFIGIHGIGRGDPNIHRDFHWTEGCIALTNEQIDALAPWIEIGTRVVIR
jgi:murein L,D-transpeptidase YafK